jgi:solute:Na+ symporter, SSS family
MAMIGWVTGVSVIWSGLFLVGNVLYGRWDYAAVLFAVLAVSGTILVRVIKRLWN